VSEQDDKQVKDLLMCVGVEHYPTAQDFIDEAVQQGVSKRLPVQSPPKGMVPHISRIYFRHERAILFTLGATESLVAELRGLGDEVVERAWAVWERDHPDAHLRHLPSLIWRLGELHLPTVDEVLKRHGVAFFAGVVGYTHFTGFAYVTNAKTGTEIVLPDSLDGLEGVRAVKVVRVREDEDDGHDDG